MYEVSREVRVIGQDRSQLLRKGRWRGGFAGDLEMILDAYLILRTRSRGFLSEASIFWFRLFDMVLSTTETKWSSEATFFGTWNGGEKNKGMKEGSRENFLFFS